VRANKDVGIILLQCLADAEAETIVSGDWRVCKRTDKEVNWGY